jgi:hypothetical protein
VLGKNSLGVICTTLLRIYACVRKESREVFKGEKERKKEKEMREREREREERKKEGKKER